LLRLLAVLLLVIVVGALAVWAYQSGTHASASPTAESAPSSAAKNEPPAKRAIFGLGTLEPASGMVIVSSPLVGTKIRQMLVREGQTVKSGDILIELDSAATEQELRLVQSQRAQTAERQQGEISAARQRLDAANLAVAQADEARTTDADAQKKQLDVAKLKVSHGQDELSRLQSLARQTNLITTTPQIEQQKSILQLAEAERDAAQAALTRVETALKFNLQKAQAEQKAAQESLQLAERSSAVGVLDEQVKLAEQKVKQTKVTAPSAGTVISVSAHAGELVANQPLLQIADLHSLECHAEIDVADLPQLTTKREAFISCRAFQGRRVKATIERVRSVAGAATLRPVDPRKAVDRTVATVVLKLQDPQLAAELVGGPGDNTGPVLIGLQVDVEIPL
jgi:HlyD family secretion protein